MRPELAVVAEHPTLLFRHDEPPFGQALIISGEHLYAFGCPRDGFDYLETGAAETQAELAELAKLTPA